MEKIRWKRVFGFALIWLGLFISLSEPLASITGFVVTEVFASSFGAWSYVIGLILIIFGIRMLM